MDKYIKEDGGAGDWGTDKARAKLQQDSPGQKIKRKGKMKRFREVLEGTVVEAKDWYSFNTKKLATDFAKAVKDKNADDGDLDKWLDGFAKKSGIKPKDRKMDQDIANDIVFDLAKMGYKKIDAYDLNTFEVDESVKEGTLPPALQAYQDKKNGKKPKDDEKEVEEAMSPADKAKRLKMIRQAVEKMNSANMEKAKKDALKMMKDSGMFDEDLEEGRVKDQMIKDSEKMNKKDFTRKYGKENAADLYEAVDNWVVTVAKPVNKLKKGAEQKVKARSAFEAINKAVKLWGDPALKAAPINSFSIKKESIIEGLEEGKMKEFHDYAKEGKSAQWIAKKMSLDMKTVKELMKDMDESTTDKKMLSVSDMNERAMTLPQIANKYKADIAKAQKSGSTASLKKAEKELIAWAMANNEIGNAKEAGDWLDNVVADKDQFAALLKFNS
jgi:DNA-binding CsgD family transcriptional regulator